MGVGTLVSGLYYDQGGNCLGGHEIARFLEISAQDWNTAVDDVGSGAGNVRFDMYAVGVPCGA